MRITIYSRPVDHDIWEWARAVADRERTSLARVIVDALYAARDRETTTTEAASR